MFFTDYRFVPGSSKHFSAYCSIIWIHVRVQAPLVRRLAVPATKPSAALLASVSPPGAAARTTTRPSAALVRHALLSVLVAVTH